MVLPYFLGVLALNEIMVFLNIYQEYPMLWNKKDKDYCNTKLKIEIFQSLFSDLNEKQLIMGMDMKQLKARIKSLKDVYRQELNKIEKVRKVVAVLKKFICQNWHGSMKQFFWQRFWLQETVILILDLSQNSEESVPDENSENGNSCPEETLKSPSK